MIYIVSALFLVSLLVLGRLLMKEKVKDFLVVSHSGIFCWLLWLFIKGIFPVRFHMLILSASILIISSALICTRSIPIARFGMNPYVISILLMLLISPAFLPHGLFVSFTQDFLRIISLFLSALSSVFFISVLSVFLARMMR